MRSNKGQIWVIPLWWIFRPTILPWLLLQALVLPRLQIILAISHLSSPISKSVNFLHNFSVIFLPYFLSLVMSWAKTGGFFRWWWHVIIIIKKWKCKCRSTKYSKMVCFLPSQTEIIAFIQNQRFSPVFAYSGGILKFHLDTNITIDVITIKSDIKCPTSKSSEINQI